MKAVFTKTIGNKGKKDRGVELPRLQARKTTGIQVPLQTKAARSFYKMLASSGLPVRQTEKQDRETGSCQLEKDRQERGWHCLGR